MSDRDTREPLISICVPTHDGRRDTLESLLDTVIEQERELPAPAGIEICVSDNASTDGTEAMVAQLAALASFPIRYRRHATDLGLTRNVFAAVALAQGPYCWLMSSDDLLNAGALCLASEHIRSMPGRTGYVVGSLYVDEADPAIRSRALPSAFLPPHERAAEIEGITAIYEQCGNAWIALSCNIAHRATWAAIVDRHQALALEHPVYPHVVMLAMMARERPSWATHPAPLVRQRNATTFLFENGDAPLADRWGRLIGDFASVWSDILGGRRRQTWRRQMRQLARVWGRVEDVRATKLYQRPSIATQWRFTRVLVASLWPTRALWRGVLAAALAPTWLTRARHDPAGGWLQRPVTLAIGQIELAGVLPPEMNAEELAYALVSVANRGRRSVPNTGAHAVSIGQRWWDLDGALLSPMQLGINNLAALPVSLPRKIRARRSVSVEVPLYAPRDAGAYRVAITASQPGRWLDEAGISPSLGAHIAIVGAAPPPVASTDRARSRPPRPSPPLRPPHG